MGFLNNVNMAGLCHLDSPGVLHKTPTLESFLNLEPGLWHWALPYHHTVVGRLGGHLLCLSIFQDFLKCHNLQLSRSTSFESGHKILRHSSKLFFLHPDVRSVFTQARPEVKRIVILKYLWLCLSRISTWRQCSALRSFFWPSWTPQARLQWVQDHSSFQPLTSSSNTWRRIGLKKLCQSHLVVSMSIFFASSDLLKARILSKESFLRLMSMPTSISKSLYILFINHSLLFNIRH